MANTHKAVIAAPLLSLAVYLILWQAGLTHVISATVAITVLTAIWWISNAVPMAAASLVPIALFPLTGVLSHKQAAEGLGSHIIMLFLGGLLLAKAVEVSMLHKRVAMGLLSLAGGRSGKPLVFAFMITAALLSMWISNTATALVLMPIAIAVLATLDDDTMKVPLILGIAFACNLGGIGTLVGTMPNLVFAGVYEEITGLEFGFMHWFSVGLPVVLIGLPITGLWLTRKLAPGHTVNWPASGGWTRYEKRTAIVFGLVVFGWVFRQEPFGGWSGLLGITHAGDSTVAVIGAILLFVTPRGDDSKAYLLNWEKALEIPWGILLLFAGGLTIAKAFQVSGTAQLLGDSLASVSSLPVLALILCLCIATTFITEITSNTASTTLFMPIMAATATAAGIPVELMMIPVAISASCAFMLPVATPPNAVAYSTGYVSMAQMTREGVVLNVLMAMVVAGVCYIQLA